MATKRPSVVKGKGLGKPDPLLERREEKEHRDLDHDGERGESAAHRARVLGSGSGSGGKGKGKGKAAMKKGCGCPGGKPCPHDKKGGK